MGYFLVEEVAVAEGGGVGGAAGEDLLDDVERLSSIAVHW